MPIEIPERHRGGLNQLSDLSSESFDSVREALELARGLDLQRDLADHVAASVPGVAVSDLRAILDSVVSLSAYRWSISMSVEQLANDVLDALRGTKDHGLDGEKAEIFHKRLVELLQSRTVTMTAKAAGLWAEHERNLIDARILTDIRPIFSEDSEARLEGSLVVHTLRLSFHEGSRHQELYVALDSDDLDDLRDAIDRAKAKHDSVKRLLDKAGVFCVDV